MSTLDWVNIGLSAIWFLGIIIYFREYQRMAKAYTALTKSLLPLEKRIMDLETLVLPDRDF